MGKIKKFNNKNLGEAGIDRHKDSSKKGKSHAGENSPLLLKKEKVKFSGKKENLNSHNQKDNENNKANQQMSSESQKVTGAPQQASPTLASSGNKVKRKRKNKRKSNNKYKSLSTKQGEGGDKIFVESQAPHGQGENLSTSHAKTQMGSNSSKIGVGVKRVAKDPIVTINKKRKMIQGIEKSASLGSEKKTEINAVSNINTQAGEKETPATKREKKKKRKRKKAGQPREINLRKTDVATGEISNAEKPVTSENVERGSNGLQETTRSKKKRKRKRKRTRKRKNSTGKRTQRRKRT